MSSQRRFSSVEELFTRTKFAEQLNTTFRTQLADAKVVELELAEVVEGQTTPRQDYFSIIFRGPQDTYLQQSIYRLEHDEMGMLELFLVPVGRDEKGFQYEAIFNRMIPIA
jgi:hypothetical protein